MMKKLRIFFFGTICSGKLEHYKNLSRAAKITCFCSISIIFGVKVYVILSCPASQLESQMLVPGGINFKTGSSRNRYADLNFIL